MGAVIGKMPEPVPTTEGIREGKKIPKWGYFAIGGAVVVGLFLYKKRKEQNEFQPAETGGQNLETDLGSLAGGGTAGGSGAGLSAIENNAFLTRFLEQSAQQQKEEKESILKILKELVPQGGQSNSSGSTTSTGTSGGGGANGTPIVPPNPINVAPENPAIPVNPGGTREVLGPAGPGGVVPYEEHSPGGVVTVGPAPPPPSAPIVTEQKPQPPSPSCPPGWFVGPHGCYQVCYKGKQRCHCYKNGVKECF